MSCSHKATRRPFHTCPSRNPAYAYIFPLLSAAISYVVRPFGGLVFGCLGDIAGRKYTFFLTIVIMGISTVSLNGWAQVAAEVHQAGGRIVPQLWHQGLSRKAGTGPHPEVQSQGPVAADPNMRRMQDHDARLAETPKELEGILATRGCGRGPVSCIHTAFLGTGICRIGSQSG